MKVPIPLDVNVPFLDKRVLKGLFPPGVSLGLALAQDKMELLHPLERKKLEKAVGKRQREFATTRILAKNLMYSLSGKKNCLSEPFLSGEKRQPLWPKGFLGSLSHKNGLCAAAVSLSENFIGLGLDVEEVKTFKASAGIAKHICGTRELEDLNSYKEKSSPYSMYLLRVFCAKEALYKAVYPLVGEYFGFHDAEISLSLKKPEFEVRYLRPFAKAVELRSLRGRYKEAGGYLFAAVTLKKKG